MKTQAEVDAYLKSIKRWREEDVDFANPGPKHMELYDFKATLDLGQYQPEFLGTTSDMAYKKNSRGWIDEDVTWTIQLEGLGTAHLHLYCTPEIEDMGTWAEFWFSQEPWWNGDDPYECTTEQIAAIVRALPEEHRVKYQELASRSPKVTAYLIEMGVFDISVPKP
jgi:hypothetical protein